MSLALQPQSPLKVHDDLINILRARKRKRESQHGLTISSKQPSPAQDPHQDPTQEDFTQPLSRDLSKLTADKKVKLQLFPHLYIPEEETIRNDYQVRYIQTGDWPGNYIAGVSLEERGDEYPKHKTLLTLKQEQVNLNSHAPYYLPFLNQADMLSELGGLKFDTILITPPPSYTWTEIANLPIRNIAADPSFVYLWVGEGWEDGLERGREVLARWGFRRCEEIIWVKTNKSQVKGPGNDEPPQGLFHSTKEHLLMGIKGTVRRATDGAFVNCNIDTDIIVWEADTKDPSMKPPELYEIMENFCLGNRRIELFGNASRARRGWLTVTTAPSAAVNASYYGLSLEDSPPKKAVKVEPEREKSVAERVEEVVSGFEKSHQGVVSVERWDIQRFDKQQYDRFFASGGKLVVPLTSDIENLRPKSPVRRGSGNASSTPNLPQRGTIINRAGAQNQPQLHPLPQPPHLAQYDTSAMMSYGGFPFVTHGTFNPAMMQQQHAFQNEMMFGQMNNMANAFMENPMVSGTMGMGNFNDFSNQYTHQQPQQQQFQGIAQLNLQSLSQQPSEGLEAPIQQQQHSNADLMRQQQLAALAQQQQLLMQRMQMMQSQGGRGANAGNKF